MASLLTNAENNQCSEQFLNSILTQPVAVPSFISKSLGLILTYTY